MTNQDPEKITGTSLDISEQNRAQLKQLFPSVFTETKNNKGDLVESIDFEKLKAELGTFSDLFESRRERYGMDWPGKKEALRLIQTPSAATLKPCREESVNFDTTENLFIEGDNLEVLKLLQKSYYGKVKMIYIDPPYNTGNEFIYPDNFAESLETYLEYAGLMDSEGKKFTTNNASEGRFHTKWLNMMFPRLYLARNLLRDDGMIFISIDENEVSNLRKLCDEIFGEENHIATIANVNNPKGRSDDKFVATAHESIIFFAKHRDNAVIYGFEPEEHITRRYNKSDGLERYREIDLRKTGDNDRREDRPNLFYYFYYNQTSGELYPSREDNNPEGFIQIKPIKDTGEDGNWRWGLDTCKANTTKLLARYMPNRRIWGVFEKDLLEGRPLVKPTTAWTFKEVNSERGSESFIELGFEKEVFPRPKPVGLIQKLLNLSTQNQVEPDLIMDFFAGSATTAHAILDLNKQDNGTRRFILVQLPEPCDESSQAFKSGYKTISDISKDRIRKAIVKLSTENTKILKDEVSESPQLFTSGIQTAKQKNATDLGFKVFKLDLSNFRLWQKLDPSVPVERIEEQLSLHIDHVDHQATPEDLLYEILLKTGFTPTEKIETKNFAGTNVFSVADGALLLCLEDTVTKEFIDQIAEIEPMQFICLDSAFHSNEQLKANAVQTFTARNMQKEKHNQIIFKTI